MKILIIGDDNQITVGSHFLKAAHALQCEAKIVPVRLAYQAPTWLRRLAWWWDKRPFFLNTFSDRVFQTCRQFKPQILLATGLCPVQAQALDQIKRLGVTCVNFLTDDPWNPAHRNRWFLEALPKYDFVFNPRRSNLQEIQAAGCARVFYLPFAYQPDIHHVEAAEPGLAERIACDVFFAGGADPDRIHLFEQLSEKGYRMRLYGDYWGHSPILKRSFFGYADPTLSRKLASTAKISICLVRKANRDGHSMRTFELPAQGACMVVEDTPEHREIFQPVASIVPFFKTAEDLGGCIEELIHDDAHRERIRESLLKWIQKGDHTYQARLKEICRTLEQRSANKKSA